MNTSYRCLWCEQEFVIPVTDIELRSSLEADRVDVCPKCGGRVGAGPVRCRGCGTDFVASFPHWHVQCDLANEACPSCGRRFISLCIC